MPSACEGCPHYEMCKGTACVAEKRHVIDAVVTVNVTEHQYNNVYFSLMELHHLNLMYSPNKLSSNISYGYLKLDGTYTSIENTKLSPLGMKLCTICLQ